MNGMPKSLSLLLCLCSPEEDAAVRRQLALTAWTPTYAVVDDDQAIERLVACAADVAVIGSAVAKDPHLLRIISGAMRNVPKLLFTAVDETPSPATTAFARLDDRAMHDLPAILRRELTESADRDGSIRRQELFRSLLDQINDGAWIADQHGTTTYANPRMAAILGCSVDELIGSSIFDHIPTEWRAHAEECFAQSCRGLEDEQHFLFVRKDGELVRTRLCATAIHDEHGRFSGAQAIVVDLSAETHAARTIEELEAQLVMAQELATVRAWRWDLATNQILVAARSRDEAERSLALVEVLARVHPDDRNEFVKALHAAVDQRTEFDHLCRVLRADGTEAHAAWRGKVIVDEDERVISVAGVTRDLHPADAESAQQELLEAEEITARERDARIAAEGKFHALVEQSLIGVYVIAGRSVRYANPRAAEIFGYGTDEPIDDVMQLVDERDREMVSEQFAARLAGNPTAAHYVARCRRRDGRAIDIEFFASAMERDGKRVLIGMFVDVTERVRAERALQRSEECYRTLVEHASDVVFSVDAKGAISSLNPAFELLTGWPAAEWLGRPFLALLRPESVAVARANFEMLRTREPRFVAEYGITTRAGEMRTIEINVRALVVDGLSSGAICIARDVTGRKETEQRVEQEQRLAGLGRLAASVAHEFNNVLMSIQPFAEVIARRLPAQSPLLDSTQHIIQAVRRGKQISQEILRFARPADPELAPLDVRQWLTDFRSAAEQSIGSQFEIRIRIEADGPLFILADRLLLDQLAMNLLHNARDAMRDGGVITIRVRRNVGSSALSHLGSSDEVIEIAVIDTGSGMSADVLSHAFDPLFTTKPTGVGLGLSIAHQAMIRQNGVIRATSAPGAGSTFALLFHGTDFVPLAATTEIVVPARGRRIVLVEDDAAVAAGLVAILTEEGFEVELAARGLAAADLITATMPDLMLLDVNLPDISGFRLYDLLHARWPQLPVIFSSGQTDAANAEGEHLQHVPSIAKPYDIAELLVLIDRVLPGHRASQASIK